MTTNRELAELYCEAVDTGQTCDKIDALTRLFDGFTKERDERIAALEKVVEAADKMCEDHDHKSLWGGWPTCTLAYKKSKEALDSAQPAPDARDERKWPPVEMDREAAGREVRRVWVAWAYEHPKPKAHWLLPWEALDETDREVDRRIGESLYRSGYDWGRMFYIVTLEEISRLVGGSGYEKPKEVQRLVTERIRELEAEHVRGVRINEWLLKRIRVACAELDHVATYLNANSFGHSAERLSRIAHELEGKDSGQSGSADSVTRKDAALASVLSAEVGVSGSAQPGCSSPKLFKVHQLRIYIQHHKEGEPDGKRPYVSCSPPSEGQRREQERQGYLFFETLVPLPGVWSGGETVEVRPIEVSRELFRGESL